MGRGFESLRSHSHFLLKNPASFSRTRGFFVVNSSTCTSCLNRAFYPPSTGESLSLISIVDWIPRETRSSAFAIVLGVRSRSSRVRSWIWVEAPRRSTERDLANFATYGPCRGRLVPSPEGWYILCRGRRPRWRRGAKRLDGADVRCEGSSRIFCKIHYRAFASPTAPKNRLSRCTLTPIQSAAFKHRMDRFEI